MWYWCNRSVITRCNLAVSEVPICSSAKTHQIAYTYCSVGISDLKPVTGTSADQLPHKKSRPLAMLRTKVAVFTAIILTIEPQPAGPTFARCAFTGPTRDQIDCPWIQIYIYIPEKYASQLVSQHKNI